MQLIPVLRKSLACLGATLLFAVTAHAQTELPATPAAVKRVVSIQPFELEKDAQHLWRREKPALRTGYLLVLEVDRDLVRPRQIAEPVLYVGRQTAERLNVGDQSGYVVAVVPAVTDPKARGYVDLARERIWFGTPELPERVGAQRIAREHRAAVQAGIRPFTPEAIAAARGRGGSLRRLETKRELVHDAMRRLVRVYSPQERELVEGHLGRTTRR